MDTNKNSLILEKLKKCLDVNRQLQKVILNEVCNIGSLMLTLSKTNETNKQKSSFSMRLIPLFKKIDDNHDSLCYPHIVGSSNQREKWSKGDVIKLKRAIEDYSRLNKLFNNTDISTGNNRKRKRRRAENENQSKNSANDSQKNENISKSEPFNNGYVFDGIDFKNISVLYVKTHSPMQCLLYWKNLLRVHPKDTVWSKDDEKLLISLARKNDLRNWEQIALELDRTPIICIIHYMKYFDTYDHEFDEGELLEHRWLSRQFTEEEDQKIREIASTLSHDSWSSVCHLFLGRTALGLKRRHALLLKRDSGSNWDSAKDLELIKLYQLYGDNFEFISKHMGDIGENKCRNRLKLLENNQVKDIWKIGLKSEKRKYYDVKNEIEDIEGSVNLETIENKEENVPKNFVEYKRLFSLEMMKLKKKRKDLMSKKTDIEKWRSTYRYIDYCIYIMENCLKPDLNASDWKFRYIVLHEFSKIPKKDIYHLKESVVNSTDNFYYDKDFGIKFVNPEQSNSFLFNRETEPKSIVFRLFGRLLFAVIPNFDQKRESKQKNVEKSDESQTQTIRTSELLAKNEALLQKTDLSRFKLRKRRQ